MITKIILLGSSQVGKTTLMNKIAGKNIEERPLPTIWSDFFIGNFEKDKIFLYETTHHYVPDDFDIYLVLYNILYVDTLVHTENIIRKIPKKSCIFLIGTMFDYPNDIHDFSYIDDMVKTIISKYNIKTHIILSVRDDRNVCFLISALHAMINKTRIQTRKNLCYML